MFAEMLVFASARPRGCLILRGIGTVVDNWMVMYCQERVVNKLRKLTVVPLVKSGWVVDLPVSIN